VSRSECLLLQYVLYPYIYLVLIILLPCTTITTHHHTRSTPAGDRLSDQAPLFIGKTTRLSNRNLRNCVLGRRPILSRFSNAAAVGTVDSVGALIILYVPAECQGHRNFILYIYPVVTKKRSSIHHVFTAAKTCIPFPTSRTDLIPILPVSPSTPATTG
jgi:hypothetical protein